MPFKSKVTQEAEAKLNKKEKSKAVNKNWYTSAVLPWLIISHLVAAGAGAGVMYDYQSARADEIESIKQETAQAVTVAAPVKPVK